MTSKLLFIYDGECPFCNQFAALLELKSGIKDIEIKNAREHPNELPKAYDMDIKGAILIKGDQTFSGARAINYICSEIQQPSDTLLKILSSTFSSNQRADFIFTFLLIARRISLFLKGVPRKIVS